jgi:RNA polymerase sigma-70 factor (ECF subfamily)
VTDQPQQPKDIELRQSLAAGEYRVAFERLLELYSTKVFHLAYSMLRNETQAEDMTQEIFLRIWKGLPGYHGGAALSTWIYAIARNTCLTELKRRAARPTVSFYEPEFEDALDHLPALQTHDTETCVSSDLNHMLGQLPEKYRQVITLFYLEEKSYEEVAAALGLLLGTVKTFLFRARKQLFEISQRTSQPLINSLTH